MEQARLLCRDALGRSALWLETAHRLSHRREPWKIMNRLPAPRQKGCLHSYNDASSENIFTVTSRLNLLLKPGLIKWSQCFSAYFKILVNLYQIKFRFQSLFFCIFSFLFLLTPGPSTGGDWTGVGPNRTKGGPWEHFLCRAYKKLRILLLYFVFHSVLHFLSFLSFSAWNVPNKLNSLASWIIYSCGKSMRALWKHLQKLQ